jgi:hypothetical protein
MDIKKQIKIALGLESDEVTLGWQSKSEDGTIFVSTAEELESGVDISVLTEDGTTIPLPTGTYKTQDGVSFRVEEDGVVSEVMESETEEEDTKEEEMSTDLGKKDEDDYESEAEETDWAKTYEEMKDKVENLEDAIADIKKQIGESGDVEEMSEETKEETVEETVEETKTELSLEELKAENEKLKTELNAKPADSPVNVNKFSSERPVLSKKNYNKLSKRERFLYNLNK